MKQIVKWKANDGSEWNSRETCVTRDRMIEDVEYIMFTLKAHPTELNWEGYVQHDEETILECKRDLFKIADQEGILKWWIDRQKTDHNKTEKELIEVGHPSWFCRMLDGAHQPLERGYARLCCIDENFREWNQPYYASHPEQCKDVCVG